MSTSAHESESDHELLADSSENEQSTSDKSRPVTPHTFPATEEQSASASFNSPVISAVEPTSLTPDFQQLANSDSTNSPTKRQFDMTFRTPPAKRSLVLQSVER